MKMKIIKKIILLFKIEKLNENEIDTNVKKKIQKEENKNKYENVNIKILLDFEKISLNLYDFIKKVSSHRKIYEKIRSIILDLKPYYYFISNNLNKFFDDIVEILKNSIKENFKIIILQKITNFHFNVSLIIGSFYDNIKYYQLQIMNHKQIKSYENLLKKLNVDTQNKKDILFINYLNSLLKKQFLLKNLKILFGF